METASWQAEKSWARMPSAMEWTATTARMALTALMALMALMALTALTALTALMALMALMVQTVRMAPRVRSQTTRTVPRP